MFAVGAQLFKKEATSQHWANVVIPLGYVIVCIFLNKILIGYIAVFILNSTTSKEQRLNNTVSMLIASHRHLLHRHNAAPTLIRCLNVAAVFRNAQDLKNISICT